MSAVYLLHFARPIGNPDNPRAQAQHYLGCATDLERRLERHRRGTSKAAIVNAFHEAGIEFEVARVWEGEDRVLENHLKKHYKSARKLCPICQREKKEKESQDVHR